ncbi:MAG: Uma2 family endonuclease [Chthoniobacteraceae bacterium]
MSTASSLKTWISPEDYLEGELLSDIRHEYLAGELRPVHDMAGATTAHNHIAGNIFGELYVALRGKKCAPFMNDMKAHIESAGDEWFYYPDVMVNCDPAGQQKLYCDTPAIIVEVLSPSSEDRDRHEKAIAYRTIPTLHTYVLVAQDRREILAFRRGDNVWTREVLPDAGSALRFPQIECEIPLDAIYARTGL